LHSDDDLEGAVIFVLANQIAVDYLDILAFKEVPHVCGVGCPVLGGHEHGDVPVDDLLGGVLEYGYDAAVGLLDSGVAVDDQAALGLVLTLVLDHAFPFFQFALLLFEPFFFLFLEKQVRFISNNNVFS